MNRLGIDTICQNCICFSPKIVHKERIGNEIKGNVGCKYANNCKKLYDYRRAQEDN